MLSGRPAQKIAAAMRETHGWHEYPSLLPPRRIG
jgi:hypothetical protein